jgi:hypothetical protein
MKVFHSGIEPNDLVINRHLAEAPWPFPGEVSRIYTEKPVHLGFFEI